MTKIYPSITEVFQPNYIKSSFIVFLTKLKNQKFNFENASLEHPLKVNQIFNDSFEYIAFSDKKSDLYLEIVANDINFI